MRTMFPRDVRNPDGPKELAKAKELEVERKRWDPGYLTRDEAAAIPQRIVDTTPELRMRIEASRPNWPEHNATASIALGRLPQGEGETVQDRSVPAAQVFGGAPLRAPEE